MQLKTEQILATLQIIIEPESGFNLPGHEDGGYISPFVWEVSQNGEFNILNLCCSQGWLKLTDSDATIKNLQLMEYVNNFNGFSLNSTDKTAWSNKIETLFQILSQSLQNLESFNIKASSYFPSNDSVGLIVGKTADKNWIAVCPTLYKETNISQKQISRIEQIQSINDNALGENTLNLLSQIQSIISELGIIDLEGDFGGGYYYSYAHQIVYGVAETKEQAIANALQASGMLEISKFQSFFPDKQYSDSAAQYSKYDKLNKFLHHTFTEVMMYRFSFWTQENIYIIGQITGGDWAGLYIESEFVYNP